MFDKNILCYVRPWNEKQFKIICKHAFPDSNIVCISDFPNHNSQFQEKLSKVISCDKKLINKTPSLSDEEIFDIIQRCRLLRTLSNELAKKMVESCFQIVNDYFDRYNPTHVIGLTVDSYVIDVIRIISNNKSSGYIGLVPLFINGYCRISARGEYTRTREVKDKEVDLVYEELVIKKSKPSFLNQFSSKSALRKNWFKNYIKNIARYYFMKIIRLRSLSYKYCYHYWSSEVLGSEEKERTNLNLFDYSPIFQKNSCYIPLQYFPECTVDYWVKDLGSIKYYSKLLEVVTKLSKDGVNIYIKEHPNSLGLRPKQFYEGLKKITGVILLDPSLNSDYVINLTDFTLVWTGSAGAEAFLEGKPVIHLGDPYYINENINFIKYKKDIPSFVANKITTTQKKEFIRKILEGSLHNPFYHDYEKRLQDRSKSEMIKLGIDIGIYINQKYSRVAI